jgi:hypothetical protein
VSSALKARIGRFLRRLILAGFLGAAAITLVAYAADYAVFRYGLHTNAAFGQITVSSYDAVQQKNGKTVFMFNPPEPQTCVHTLFPHAGFVPCWYLQRHTEPRTNI